LTAGSTPNSSTLVDPLFCGCTTPCSFWGEKGKSKTVFYSMWV
jgi:hypothetical protein